VHNSKKNFYHAQKGSSSWNVIKGNSFPKSVTPAVHEAGCGQKCQEVKMELNETVKDRYFLISNLTLA
jgi:hypothetical protein